MPQIDLNTLAGGALREKLQIEFDRVAANISDPNTSDKSKRSITVKLTFEPDEDREFVLAVIDTDSKLAPMKSTPAKFLVGTERGGKSVMEELVSGAKGQMMITTEGNIADDKGRAVDTETGEVKDSKVVAFR